MLASLTDLSEASSSGAYRGGDYRRDVLQYSGTTVIVNDFNRGSGVIKAKYFARNAYLQYSEWLQHSGKRVVYLCSGAFADSFTAEAAPIGLCVDNGDIVSRSIHSEMDALLVVYNGGAQVGGIVAVNLDYEAITVEGSNSYWPRDHGLDLFKFLDWSERNGATVFQTQWLYSTRYGYGSGVDPYSKSGKSAKRRMLAVCVSERGEVHHMIVEIERDEYLDRSAALAVDVIEQSYEYQIVALVNLDRGAKDIMEAYNDYGVRIAQGSTQLSNATNLLVYYTD